MEIITSGYVEVNSYLRFKVTVTPDMDYSPSEYTTEAESPELFKAWRNGDMQYVGVIVTPEVMFGQSVDWAADSLWGVEYGNCEGWETPIDLDYLINTHPVPDMIKEAKGNLARLRDTLNGLPLTD